MLKRNKHKPATDVNDFAHQLESPSTSNSEGDIERPTRAQISMVMAELGRKGGKIGGKRRLQTMTAEERSQIAKRAAEARWKGH